MLQATCTQKMASSDAHKTVKAAQLWGHCSLPFPVALPVAKPEALPVALPVALPGVGSLCVPSVVLTFHTGRVQTPRLVTCT